METEKTHVKKLIEKAASADKPGDAMQYAQASLNAANAIIGLSNIKNKE